MVELSGGKAGLKGIDLEYEIQEKFAALVAPALNEATVGGDRYAALEAAYSSLYGGEGDQPPDDARETFEAAVRNSIYLDMGRLGWIEDWIDEEGANFVKEKHQSRPDVYINWDEFDDETKPIAVKITKPSDQDTEYALDELYPTFKEAMKAIAAHQGEENFQPGETGKDRQLPFKEADGDEKDLMDRWNSAYDNGAETANGHAVQLKRGDKGVLDEIKETIRSHASMWEGPVPEFMDSSWNVQTDKLTPKNIEYAEMVAHSEGYFSAIDHCLKQKGLDTEFLHEAEGDNEDEDSIKQPLTVDFKKDADLEVEGSDFTSYLWYGEQEDLEVIFAPKNVSVVRYTVTSEDTKDAKPWTRETVTLEKADPTLSKAQELAEEAAEQFDLGEATVSYSDAVPYPPKEEVEIRNKKESKVRKNRFSIHRQIADQIRRNGI